MCYNIYLLYRNVILYLPLVQECDIIFTSCTGMCYNIYLLYRNVKHKDQIAQLIQRGYDKDPVKVWQTDYDRMLNTNPEDVEVEDDQVRLEQGTNQGPSPLTKCGGRI